MKKIGIFLGILLFIALGIGGYVFGFALFSTRTVSLTTEAEENSAEENSQVETPSLAEEEANNISTTAPDDQAVPAETSKEKTSLPKAKTGETEKSVASTFNINQHLVSWGYQTASQRKISAIIIHSSYDAEGNDPYDVSGLINEYKDYGVAPHYLIDRQGQIYQLVAEKNIAYHAGVATLPNGVTEVNAVSLGIEIMTTKKESPTAAQYTALKHLLADIKSRYTIQYVLGHDDIAPGRKDDPWNFNWAAIK